MHLMKTVLLLTLAAVRCQATALYSNTTTDQLDSAFYSTLGVTEIGDQIQLFSAGMLTSLDAQFFNVGADATFDAVLRFYNVGGPVGTQIGGPFTAANIFIASGTSATATFSNLGNLLVPQDVVATFSVQNVSAGGDLGLNFFDPPTLGNSSASFFIVYDGTAFSQASTNLDHDNLYMEISGAPVSAAPEPSPAPILAGVLIVMACWKTGLRIRQRR